MVRALYKADDKVIILAVGLQESSFFEDARQKEEHHQQAFSYAEKLVAKASEKATELGFTNVEGKVAVGSPRELILQIAAETEADVIALGARGLGQIKRVILGSVSDYVMKHAAANVMIAKLSEREKQELEAAQAPTAH